MATLEDVYYGNEQDNEKWYILERILSHNALINMINGARGFGKTYSVKKKVLNNFLDKSKQFIYLRRLDSEVEKVRDTLFNDVLKESKFEGLQITRKGNTYFADGKECGYIYCLSTDYKNLKSASFPDVTTIIFDEYLIDDTKPSARYLKNEVQLFMEFLESVIRTRDDCIVIMMANNFSSINPYTIYFDIDIKAGREFNKNKTKDVVLQIAKSKAFEEYKTETRLGRLMNGTEYGDYAIKGKYILDSDTFIEKRPNNSRLECVFVFPEVTLGLWYLNDTIYISEKHDPNHKIKYTFDLSLHDVNTLFTNKRGYYVELLIDSYKHHRVRFDNQKCKKICEQYFIKNSY